MRPLALDIGAYGDVLRTSGHFSGTSLGLSFAEWVACLKFLTVQNLYLYIINHALLDQFLLI